MFDIGSRLFLLALAGVLLWMAWHTHKIQPKPKRADAGGGGGPGGSGKKSLKERNKEAAILLGFVGGLALVAGVATAWVTTAINWLGDGLPLLGCLVCAAIIGIDWLWDGKPDRPALIAAMVVPLFLVYGIANLGVVPETLGDSWDRMTASVSDADLGN